MLFDARLRPAYSPARVNRALVTNGQIGTCQGCMGLSHIHNEYPYRRYEQQNQGFLMGLESYSVQTIYVTAVNVLTAIEHIITLNAAYHYLNCCITLPKLLHYTTLP